MSELTAQKCTACHSDAPAVTAEEMKILHQQVPDWQIVEHDGVPHLERVYKVKDFLQALALANKIGELAEEEGHHPAILVEWGKVMVGWWTHAIRNLHRNDFIMAAKTDRAYKSLDSDAG